MSKEASSKKSTSKRKGLNTNNVTVRKPKKPTVKVKKISEKVYKAENIDAPFMPIVDIIEPALEQSKEQVVETQPVNDQITDSVTTENKQEPSTIEVYSTDNKKEFDTIYIFIFAGIIATVVMCYFL